MYTPQTPRMSTMRSTLSVATLLLAVFSASSAARRLGGANSTLTHETLLSWAPTNTNGLSMVPGGPGSTLEWWMGFGPVGTNVASSATDGTTFTQNPHTLTQEPLPGTPLSSFGTLDHVKHLAFAQPYNARPDAKLVFSINMTAQVTIPSKLPFSVVNPQDDMRLGACCMNFIDFGNMIVADIVLTRTGIWALYERLPFARTAENVYAAFTYVKRIGSRTKPTQVHELQVKYDQATNTLEWWADGVVGLKVSKVGRKPKPSLRMRVALDLGGSEELVTVPAMQAGFGCFSLLDFAEVNGRRRSAASRVGLLNLNPSADPKAEVYVIPSSFKVDTRTNASAITDPSWRIFGQGTSMTVSSFKVAYEPRDA